MRGISVKLIISTFMSLLLLFVNPQASGQALVQRELSIEERILIPAAGCDNGNAISNFSVPQRGGATPKCLSRGKQSSLPEHNQLRHTDGIAEVGTVVVLSLSKEQAVLAADSRGGRIDLRSGKFLGITDQRCKLVRLNSNTLFAATGQTRTGTTIQSRIYYDAQLLAKAAVRNFAFDASGMRENETVIEIATKWVWDIAFRIQRGTRSGTYKPPNTGLWLTGVFVGTETNGDISVAIASLEYHKPRAMMDVPAVSLSIRVPVLPKDFTWIEAFGHKEVAEKYYSAKRVSSDTAIEFRRIRAEQLRNPSEFRPQVVVELAQLARDKETHAFPEGSQQVGGRIDVARLIRGGRVEWISRKRKCDRWR
jgi:hypothetical protein